KGTAIITLSNLTQTYDGSAKPVTVTVSPAGLNIAVTYDGKSTAPSNAGSYAVVASLVGNDKKNYNADDATGTLTINQATATITLSNLTQTYNGSPRVVTATTSPAGVNVAITYDGSTTAPTNVGSYAVVASETDPNNVGPNATGTVLIKQGDETSHVVTTIRNNEEA